MAVRRPRFSDDLHIYLGEIPRKPDARNTVTEAAKLWSIPVRSLSSAWSKEIHSELCGRTTLSDGVGRTPKNSIIMLHRYCFCYYYRYYNDNAD